VEQQTPGIVWGRRRSRAEAEQVVQEFEASGLRQLEFCRQKGLGLSTLVRYRQWRREKETQEKVGNENRWLAVEVAGHCGAGGNGVTRTANRLAVVLAGGRRIEVEPGFDAPTLLQLMSLLERN
jgi:hypothetical protein